MDWLKILVYIVDMASKTLIISNSVELLRLHATDIVCIEAEGNYTVLQIVGDEKRTLLLQLGQLECMMSEQLAEEAANFIRIGRGLIVNRNYIYYINLTLRHIMLRDNLGHRYKPIHASHNSLKRLKELVENDSEV